MSNTILMIEDDADIVDLVKAQLSQAGFELDHAFDGEDGLDKAINQDYALVVLDLNLPKMEGLEVCRELRKHKTMLPVIMVTSRKEEVDKVLGLEIGADDYVTKPISVRELVARIKALVRRTRASVEEQRQDGEEGAVRRFGPLEINLEHRSVTFDGEDKKLTAKEFDLLVFLTNRPGCPYTKTQLLENVWDYNTSIPGYDRSVFTFINRLRAKIEPDPSNPTYIRTVRGIGYKFASQEDLAE